MFVGVRFRWLPLVAALGVVLAAGNLCAQPAAAQLTVTVTDSTGAVVADAVVLATRGS